MNYEGGQLLRVVDPELLAECASWMLERLGKSPNQLGRTGLSWSAIEERTGISRSTWGRLQRGELPQISTATSGALLRVLHRLQEEASGRRDVAEVERMHQQLDAAVYPPAAGYLFGTWAVWLARELHRLQVPEMYSVRRDTGYADLSRDDVSPRARSAAGRTASPERLRQAERARRMGMERGALVERINAVEPGALEAFMQELRARGHWEQRCELAMARVLEPLLVAPVAGFIERDWRELTDHELRQVVRAGIQRERILLARPPEDPRSHAVGSV